MIPPNQGSSLFQDSSLNKTLRDNCYILGYEGPSEISQDVPDREQTLISMVKYSEPDGEIVTCGSMYKFSMLNIPKLSHLGKNLTRPNC